MILNKKAWGLAEFRGLQMKKFTLIAAISMAFLAINGKRADIVGKAKTRATIWGANGTWNLTLHYQATQTGGTWQVQNAVATLF